jgi:hypothetical protein
MGDGCYKCGNNDILWLRGNRYICDACKFRVEPPIITLVKFWDEDTSLLYNPMTMRYEDRSINDFTGCGFQLHTVKTFFNREISPLYEQVFVLRYFGNYICKKVEEYLDWPIDLDTCPVQEVC